MSRRNAQFEEIAVEVGAVAGDGVVFLQVGLDRFQAFHAHIGRIAEDDVEAAVGNDLRESGRPVEGARRKGGVGDQAVADTQPGFEALQRLADCAVLSHNESLVISMDSGFRLTP